MRIIFDFTGDYNVVPFTKVTLGKKDKVQKGLFPNNLCRVKTILDKYGKEGVIILLQYYDLDETILKEYHIHPKKKEVTEVQEVVVLYRTREYGPFEEVVETTPEPEDTDNEGFDVDEECQDYVQTNTWDSVLYDPEDDQGDESYLPLRVCEPGLYYGRLKELTSVTIQNKIYE